MENHSEVTVNTTNHMLAVLVALTLVSGTLIAQGGPGYNKHTLGVGAEVSIPTGDFADLVGTGYGGFLKYRYGQSGNATFTLSAGYSLWSEKTIADSKIKGSAFRFLGGGQYFFAPGFFGSLEVGLDAYSFDITGSGPIGIETSTWRFMVPVGLGYEVKGFEIGAKYYIFDVNYSSFSITVGYNFTL
jgi:hypothetical protein